jgi:plasmid stabilization system protein ParE
MKQLALLLSDLAVEQLREIPPPIGRRLLEAIQRLRVFPESAPNVLLEGYEGYRQLVIRPYRVVYRYLPQEEQVRIYAVLHLRRAFPPSEFLKHQIF